MTQVDFEDQIDLGGRVDLDYLTYHPEKPEGVDMEDQVDLKFHSYHVTHVDFEDQVDLEGRVDLKYPTFHPAKRKAWTG